MTAPDPAAPLTAQSQSWVDDACAGLMECDHTRHAPECDTARATLRHQLEIIEAAAAARALAARPVEARVGGNVPPVLTSSTATPPMAEVRELVLERLADYLPHADCDSGGCLGCRAWEVVYRAFKHAAPDPATTPVERWEWTTCGETHDPVTMGECPYCGWTPPAPAGRAEVER